MDNAYSFPTETRFAQKAAIPCKATGGTFQENSYSVGISQGVSRNSEQH